MRRIATTLFLFIVACSAFAADYRISINAPEGQVANAKVLRIYGFKFAKGDRIVSISGGWHGESTENRVTLDTGSAAGTSVANGNASSGFNGKVIFAPGQAPTSSASISIDKVVPTVEGGGFFSIVAGFATSTGLRCGQSTARMQGRPRTTPHSTRY